MRKFTKNDYDLMREGLNYLGLKILKKFLYGTHEVHKKIAKYIFEYLGFQRDEIISDLEWDKTKPPSLDEMWEELCELAKFVPKRLEMKLAQLPTAGCGDRGIPKFITQVFARSKI